MRKKIVEIGVLAGFIILAVLGNDNDKSEVVKYNRVFCVKTADLPFKTLKSESLTEDQDEIRNEIFYGELEELAILIQAEAGNQDELGKRYVADCVLNRVDDKDFPDNIHDVIYQINTVQFSTTIDGGIEKAEYTVTEDCFQIALEEYENRTNSEIIYFRTEKFSSSGTPSFQYGAHYFSTR